MGIMNLREAWNDMKARREAERERKREEARLAEEERRRLEEERRRLEEEARQAHITELFETDDKELLVLMMLSIEDLQEQVSGLSGQLDEVKWELSDLSSDISSMHSILITLS